MAAAANRAGRPVSVAYRAVGAASANVALPAGSAFYLSCDQNCWIEFGDSGVVAAAGAGGSIYLPADTVVVFDRPYSFNQVKVTHIAAIQVLTGGTLVIAGLA